MKCLTIVDDATTEAVAVVPARALGGLPVTRVLEALAITRGLLQANAATNSRVGGTLVSPSTSIGPTPTHERRIRAGTALAAARYE